MAEPEKPFACTITDCGMTFTNEDHLNVHTKKHDMMLQFGPEQKAAFVADQTPTPTRFIRNCEEVGLFQDLQNVNPFDEGFKRAMETKNGTLTLENSMEGSDDLHTPQMVYPLIDPGDSALFSTTNNQRNITISRSSSDESGAIKEFETTTISKLTNEVTTISRIVGKHEEPRLEDKDTIKKDSVSYTNNVIIHSNVEIRKDNIDKIGQVINDDKKETTAKDVDTNRLQLPMPAMMSQKSIDFVVDSLTADFGKNDKKQDDNYEVFIKLPNGKRVRMKAVDDEITHDNKAKEKLKKVLTNKVEKKMPQLINNGPTVANVPWPIPTGTLIPVTLVNQNHIVSKVPILPLSKMEKPKKMVKSNDGVRVCGINRDCVVISDCGSDDKTQDLNSRSAASRRYRARLKETWSRQNNEILQLKEANRRLTAEQAMLKMYITEHMKKCPNADDLRNMQIAFKQAALNF